MHAPVSPRGRFDARLNASDTVLWRIEQDPVLRSTITTIALLDHPPDHPALRSRLEGATELVPRLRQRVVEPLLQLAPPRWRDTDVDLDFHLRRITAPCPGSFRSVLDLAASMAMARFDRARPLWECTVVDGLGGGGAALVLKVHHSLTDGVGGMQLALALLDRVDDRAVHAPQEPAAAPPSRPTARPSSATPGALLRTMASAGRLLAPTGPRLSPLMTGHSRSWRYDVLDVPLEQLHRAARKAGVSLNDAFVAAVTGGLRLYHEAHGAPVKALRMTMPVSLRTANDSLAGNHFVPLRFAVPIAEIDPRRRMLQLSQLSRAWRDEPALSLTDTIAGVLSRLPAAATTAAFASMLKGVDFVATNVPGIPFRVSIAGAELLRQYAFAPTSGAALNVALLSHGDTACVGVTIDPVAVPDPSLFMECLSRGFAEVVDVEPALARSA